MALPIRPPIAPMLARLTREIPLGAYAYEPKWDGFRCLAFRDGDEVDLRSRHDRPLARYFPEVVDALRAVPEPRFVLDGELVNADRFDFATLMARLHPAPSRVARLAVESPAALVAFDLLAAGDDDLLAEPFAERRARLEALVPASAARLRLTPLTRDPATARAWFESAAGGGIDGLIAKPLHDPYVPGRRAMVKVKAVRTAECVVAGVRLLTGRQAVSSLLLGLYDEAWALRHVGVVTQLPAAARLELLRQVEPDVVPIDAHPWRHGFAIGPSPLGRLLGSASRWTPEMGLDWLPLRPRRVVEVAYDQVDRDRFRHPARFVRWRPDRDAASCTLDQILVPDPRPAATASGVVTAGSDETRIRVDGREIRVSHPDRVLWPRTGTTKRDLIEYDLAVAPVLLPHIAGRGLTLGRWPEGVDAPGWLQAECRGRPSWMSFERSQSRRTGGHFDYCVVDDRPGLAWVANLGTIELHPFLARVNRRSEPSFVVFDLDPMPPATLLDAGRVALRIRERLDALGLVGWPKTSGMHGLHVFAPIAAGQTFDDTKAFARAIAAELAAADPCVTDRMTRRATRAGRVLVDWLQNDPSRSTVAAYSPRAAAVPLVSTPVSWTEIEAAVHLADRRALLFDFAAVRSRIDRFGDLFAPALAPGPRIPDIAVG